MQTTGRAAEAAARVAARYAKVPSFSEMQAAEAMAALRAAEAATRAALEAQSAAQLALASLEIPHQPGTPNDAEPRLQESSLAAGESWQDDVDQVPQAATANEILEGEWDPDLHEEPAPAHHSHQIGEAQNDKGRSDDFWASVPEVVEPEQPIHANLIEFPRELVATRRMRPRLTSSLHTAIGDLFGQLSIFEVDPTTVSTEPEAPAARFEAQAMPAEAWNGPAWSGIQLDDQPMTVAEYWAPPQACGGPRLQQAPFMRRLLAGTVDTALTVGLVCALGFTVVNHLPQPLSIRTAELLALAALVLTGILYQAVFLLVAQRTPGMMYAQITLRTFEDEIPTSLQLRSRVLALLVSLLPVGLGVVWAVFDDDHLTWHDRLSRTYQWLD